MEDLSFDTDPIQQLELNQHQAQLAQEEEHEEAESESESENEVKEFTILTSSAAVPLRTVRIQQVQVLPEYPQTLPSGYTYCVATDKRDTNSVLAEALAFQYCRKIKAKQKPTTCLYLGNPALRWKYQCTGAKYCEYLESSLRTRSHRHANAQLWEELRQYRRTPLRDETNLRKKHSLGLYLSIQRRFRIGIACGNHTLQCSPILRQTSHLSVSGVQYWYIGCSAWRWQAERTEDHFFRRITEKHDLEHLQKLFREGLEYVPESVTACCSVEPNTSRLPRCDVDHPQGQAQFLQWTCPVEFDIIIPRDLEHVPFFLFCSHGEHTHLPPPPHRPPTEVLQGLIELIQKERDPTATRAKFLSSHALKEFCRRNNAVSLIQIHQSFANMDRISRILWRERLTMFPAGQHIQGVIVEQTAKHRNPETAYIREVSVDCTGTIVLCFFTEQAKVFAGRKTFQCDMSFKRTFKYGFREIIFSFFNEPYGKLFTLARIFVNRDSPQMYQQCFQKLLTSLSERVGENLNLWRHLHGTGFDGMTIDMDWKQMEGFGLYLQNLDTRRRPWDWQLQNCIRFCTIHFRRSVIQAVPGLEYTRGGIYDRMESLLTCTSMEDYHTLGNLLRDNEPSPIANWAAHKLIPVISAGLNQHCSLIPEDIWNSMSPDSNAAEQTAEKSYSYRKGLPLLSAVLSGMKLDQRDIDELQARDDGIRHISRSTSITNRYMISLGREKRKRNAELNSPEPSNTLLRRSNSSGSIRGRSITSRSRSPSTQRPRTSSPRTVRSQSHKRQAFENNQELIIERERLALREKALELEEREIANMEKKLELEERRARLARTG
ncbi:hypothetical protein BU23DRAFT_496272 [Bimuria novae-zelandiae CBS 107.79]|uniref:Uncharacterized protein n=1 Tax=Bimuria novae-zelandiae CBS 107.79 TaxID=1447943 RepID=A0A6A5VS13_9PLEO|nr:hypothetical protein BU23DRAFT_496272 [Bimuria novae-zelandiae CBS 107.79]